MKRGREGKWEIIRNDKEKRRLKNIQICLPLGITVCYSRDG